MDPVQEDRVSRFFPTHRMANASTIVVVTALAAAALSLSGCGSMPTAPSASDFTSPAAGPSPAGQASLAGAPSRMPSDPPDGSGGGDTPPPDAGVAASGVANGVLASFTAGRAAGKGVASQGADFTSAGGTLTNGRWTLTVPANALATGAHFTLSVAGVRGAACQVQVSPAGPALASPLTLSVDCHGVPMNRMSDFVILGYDASTTLWTPVGNGNSTTRKHVVSVAIAGAGIFGAGYPDGTPGW
jgi:hypothetical protein